MFVKTLFFKSTRLKKKPYYSHNTLLNNYMSVWRTYKKPDRRRLLMMLHASQFVKLTNWLNTVLLSQVYSNVLFLTKTLLSFRNTVSRRSLAFDLRLWPPPWVSIFDCYDVYTMKRPPWVDRGRDIGRYSRHTVEPKASGNCSLISELAGLYSLALLTTMPHATRLPWDFRGRERCHRFRSRSSLVARLSNLCVYAFPFTCVTRHTAAAVRAG